MSNETKTKIFTWLYRVFTYIVPGGYALWAFLIEKLIDKEVTVMSKLGLTGICVLVIMIIIAIFFYGRHLKKQIAKVTDECIMCVDQTKKVELVDKKKKFEAKQELFRNICFLAPFIIAWIVLCVVEKGIVSLRGTMLGVCLSMSTGLGFNGIAQWIKSKGVDNENKENNNK